MTNSLNSELMDHTRKNGLTLEMWFTLEIMGHTLKNLSRIRNGSQSQKWVTLGKSCNSSKNGSHRKSLLIGQYFFASLTVIETHKIIFSYPV